MRIVSQAIRLDGANSSPGQFTAIVLRTEDEHVAVDTIDGTLCSWPSTTVSGRRLQFLAVG